jgi:hypothetical protein
MATNPVPQTVEDDLRNQVRQRAGEFVDLKIEPLLKNDVAGGAYNLSTARPYLETIVRISKAVLDADLRNPGESQLKLVINWFDPIRNHIQAIRAFNPIGSNQPVSERNNLISGIKTIALDAATNFGPFIAGCNISKPSEFDERAQKAIKNLQDYIGTEMGAALNKQKQTLTEMEAILEASKKAAQSVGIVEHSKFFKEESDGHQRAAYFWLFATVLLAAATVWVGWWNYTHTLDALTQAVARGRTAKEAPIQGHAEEAGEHSANFALQIQLALAKLIIFSILFSAVVWTGKMYRAHRHNAVINRHRLNALSTFEAFVKGTDDPQIRSAVLLQATQCIFGSQSTGYIAGDGETDGPQVLEIFRSVTEKSK